MSRAHFHIASHLVVPSRPPPLRLQVEPQREDCFYEDVAAGDEMDVKALVYRGGRLDVRLRVSHKQSRGQPAALVSPVSRRPTTVPSLTPSSSLSSCSPSLQIESPERSVLYDHLLFSNIDDATGELLPTIVKKGHHFTASSAGTYRVCLDNRMARWTAKVVTLDIAVTRSGVPVRDFNAPHLTRAEGDDSAQTGINIIRDSASRIMDRLALISELQHYHFWREQRHRDTVESTNTRVQWWNFAEISVWLGLLAAQVLAIRRWFSKKDFTTKRSHA